MYEDNSQRNMTPPPPPGNAGQQFGQPASPPPRFRKGCGFWVAVALAVFFFMTTVFVGLLWVVTTVGAAFSAARDSQGIFKETVVQGAQQEVLLLPVEGIITGDAGGHVMRQGSARSVIKQLEMAANDQNIRAVILSIDSPGGVITACDILHGKLASFNKPIVAYLNDTAASGGYYIACATDYIIAHPTSLTGNVGVIMPRVNIEELLDKIGVSVEPIKSGPSKDIGSPYRQMNEEELKYMQEIVDELHDRFAEVVRESLDRRGIKYETEDFERMTSGLPFTGKRAAEMGMVDRTGYMDDALRKAGELAGISDPTLVSYVRPFRLRDFFGSPRLTIQTRGPAGLAEIEDMVMSPYPRFMYLWSSGQDAVITSVDYGAGR